MMAMGINMPVLHDAAFGGDEKDVVTIERGVLQKLYRALDRKGGRRRGGRVTLTVGDLG